MRTRFYSLAFIVFFLSGFFPGIGICQEINLDKMEKFKDLICYQSLKDPAAWYYLPDQPRLAMKNGRPQFSFMKYSRTRKTGKAGTNTSEGGGIVHFLVTYGTSKDRIRAAQRRLQEKYPQAVIKGPIVYRKGSFALTTSFKEDQKTLVKTVAIGKAPLMEGQKAAVSMALTREGAELLWQSFKSDTPDISLVFDMEFAGVREPYEATIEADWSRISKHKRLKAGMKYSWFGADVDMLFQELRQNGAIKITTKGENASMDKIIQSAHAKLLQVMFDPAPVDDLAKAAAQNDSYSNLNQALKLLKGSKTETSSINLDSPGFKQIIVSILDLMITDALAEENNQLEIVPDINTEYQFPELTKAEKQPLQRLFKKGVELREQKQYSEAIDVFRDLLEIHQTLTQRPLSSGNVYYNLGFCHAQLEQYGEALKCFTLAKEIYSAKNEYGAVKYCDAQIRKINRSVQNAESKAYNKARSLDRAARESDYPADKVQTAINAYKIYQKEHKPTGSRAREVEGRLRSLERRLVEAESENQINSSIAEAMAQPDKAKPAKTEPESKSGAKTRVKQKKESADKKPGNAKTATGKPSDSKKPGVAAKKTAKPDATKKTIADKAPGFSLVASFQLKNIKRSGKMVYHMNHFRSEKQSFTMAENIGGLYRQYGHDSRIFKALTIDDPVFKQREILVTLDGQDSATFTKYMNFVTVKMKKRHQSGEITTDEIIITPETFNKQGNAFTLAYGYKDDDNRDLWLDYKYQVIWSFHGGVEIRSPWLDENSPMLALNPPYRYRSITIEGEAELLQKAQVRHAVISITTMINKNPITTRATVRNQGPAPGLHLDIPEDIKGSSGTVSITWYLKGGKKITSLPQKLEGDIIYWDELPEEERT